MAFRDYILAIGDTLKEEGPGLAAKAIIPLSRRAVKARVAPVAPKSPFVSVRLLKKLKEMRLRKKLNSVDDRVRTMPPEWHGHKEVERVIVFHDADDAGPHVEWYIIIDGQAYNMGAKRLNGERLERVGYDKKGFYNNRGELSQRARGDLLDIVREEFDGEGDGSFVPQTTDHYPHEARHEWSNHEISEGYGSGRSRTVLADDKIEIWKTGRTIEGRDYTIDKHRDFYIHKFIETDDGKVVLKIGLKEHPEYEFKGKLKLKGHHGNDQFDRFKEKVGEDGIVTIKEDGASFHFRADRHGFKAYSPRKSKVTGKRITYTHKLKDIRHHKTDQTYEGMGELLYVDKETGRVLEASEVGGVLNSNQPVPDNLEPKLVLYRVDKVGRKTVSPECYATEGYPLTEDLVRELDDPRIHKPEVVGWAEAYEEAQSREGLVGVARGESIHDGHKFKPRHDTYDWKVTKVELQDGPRGRIAGQVVFENDDGKQFKIGPSSMGKDEVVLDIKKNPDKYVGRVAKVECQRGHEGRAPKFVDWHQDKGEV